MPTNPLLSLLLPPVTAQDWTSCASLQHYVNEHPDCYVLEFGEPCSGLYCYGSDDTYLDFFVQKCEDPVTVDVFVELTDEHTQYHHDFYYLFNQSETVDYGKESYTGILERNATHLGFMVSGHEIRCETSKL